MSCDILSFKSSYLFSRHLENFGNEGSKVLNFPPSNSFNYAVTSQIVQKPKCSFSSLTGFSLLEKLFMQAV